MYSSIRDALKKNLWDYLGSFPNIGPGVGSLQCSVLIVRIVKTRGIYDRALSAICDPPLVILVQEPLFGPSGKVPTKRTIAEGRFATCQTRTRPPRRWLSMLSLSP